MKTLDYKTKLVDHLKQMQEKAISHAREAMKEAQEEANNYGVPKDRYDGFRNQQLRRKDMFAKQLSQALQNLELLNKPEILKPKNEVGFGALIQTDSDMFFVSVGLGATAFLEDEPIVVSMLVPIYQAMKGKKMGDTFSYNQRNYTILTLI